MSDQANDALEIFAKMQELQRSIEESKKSLTANNSKPIPASYNSHHRFATRGFPYSRARGTYRGSFRGSSRGSFRGSARRPYRNMSLVLNNDNNGSSDSISATDDENKANDQFVSKVSKNGLSLVNTKIYQSDQERLIDINKKILQQKIDKLQHAKKLKIQQKLQELSVRYDYCNRAMINSIEMALVNDDIRLVPISFIEDQDYKNNIEYQGYKYNKLGDGSYIQDGHSESELPRYVFLNLIIEKQSLTKNHSLEEKEPCRFYTRTGICGRGKACKYTHNKANISLCKEFLKSQCPNPNCPLSHKPTQFNSPACKFFLNGFCSNTNCLFTHKQEGDERRICRNFSIGGFCRLGKYCPLKHNFNCPDFVERHNCPRGKSCTLVHYLDGSNSYINSSMEVVRNEDNDPKGINYQAQEHPLTLDINSSDESEEEEEIEKENLSDEELIDISDPEQDEQESKDKELKDNTDFIKV